MEVFGQVFVFIGFSLSAFLHSFGFYLLYCVKNINNKINSCQYICLATLSIWEILFSVQATVPDLLEFFW